MSILYIVCVYFNSNLLISPSPPFSFGDHKFVSIFDKWIVYTRVETPHGKEADELVTGKGHGPDDKSWSRQGQGERWAA